MYVYSKLIYSSLYTWYSGNLVSLYVLPILDRGLVVV